MGLTDWQIEHVAYALFRSNMSDYGFSDELLMIEWATDEGIQQFWREQARTAIAAFMAAPENPDAVTNRKGN